MGVRIRDDAPGDAPLAINRALEDLVPQPAFDSLSGGSVLDLSQPIALYSIGLADIRNHNLGDILSHATFVSWRYLIDQGSGGGAYADVRHNNDETKLVSLSTSKNAAALIDAANIAVDLVADKEDEFEFRIIDAPAVKLSSAWISGTENFFVPYIDGLKSDLLLKVIPQHAFEEELTRRAESSRPAQDEELSQDTN
ncbi:hypothetical protein [Amaricoccus sp. W119]|uniref:hypothetical protein n=1 Tax=Amaricoccus sp. W119 TaxID=3391833 RepID=UPI0039A5559A